MRVLFTQLSLLVGLTSAANAYGSDPGLTTAILYGISAGCGAYLLLLLGDYTIHKFLEERSPDLTSVSFIEESFESTKEDDAPGYQKTVVDLDQEARAA
jgi:hypothetical protein